MLYSSPINFIKPHQPSFGQKLNAKIKSQKGTIIEPGILAKLAKTKKASPKMSEKAIASAIFNPDLELSHEQRKAVFNAYLSRNKQANRERSLSTGVLIVLALVMGWVSTDNSTKNLKQAEQIELLQDESTRLTDALNTKITRLTNALSTQNTQLTKTLNTQIALLTKGLKKLKKQTPKKSMPQPKKGDYQVISSQFEVNSLSPSKLQARQVLSSSIEKNMSSAVGDVFKHIENLAQYTRPAVVRVIIPSGNGSGYFYNASGIIVTNHHVISSNGKASTEVDIVLLNGKKAKGKVLASNKDNDLAVIQVSPQDFGLSQFPALALSSEDSPIEGKAVLATGHPRGELWTCSFGIVSSNDKKGAGGTQFIQIDAAINPGNSGGPLVDMNGKVVGLNSAKHTTAESIAYSVTAKEIRDYVEATLNKASVKGKNP